MCGKFTAMSSWREVVEFSQPLTESGGGKGQGDGEGSNDEIVTYRVGGPLRVSSARTSEALPVSTAIPASTERCARKS